MKNCEEFKNLIEKYLDGIIAEDESSELQKHTEACSSCRAEFERSIFMEDAVRQAFTSQTSAEDAGASLMTRLSSEPDRMPSARQTVALFTGMRAAVAAGILLAAGVFLGFALDPGGEPAAAPLKAEVPIRIGDIEGTVMVRREGSDIWQTLKADSKIHLGDTFHSVAKSTCVLKLDDQSTLGLNQNSMLVLETFNGETQFRLEHGELDAVLESPHPPFYISTPHGRVEALGTEFTVKVTDE
jgi:ferric-dicitrate binding protein FerR (iron transport regulator)